MSAANLQNPRRPTRILLQVSASIAAFKAVALCSKLVQAGYEIEVILSEHAKWFVGPASFEGLTGRAVHHGNFDTGKMMAHIALERWADLILLYPASANTLSQLANGASSSLIGALFLAHEFKKPYWIAPAMNQAMMNHPATQANLDKLKNWGMVFLSGEGALACGEIGPGRLIEVEEMIAAIQKDFPSTQAIGAETAKPLPAKKMRVLVTAGGTREAIDPVRSIINFSSGLTGASLAQYLENRGHDVVLLQSVHSHYLHLASQTETYDTTDEFSKMVEQKLSSSSFDFVIHAAAVADYEVVEIRDENSASLSPEQKVQSKGEITLKLKPRKKVLSQIRGWSQNKKLKMVSFKLTTRELEPVLAQYDSEWVIHNQLKMVNQHSHEGKVYARDQAGDYQARFSFLQKAELFLYIAQILEGNSA